MATFGPVLSDDYCLRGIDRCARVRKREAATRVPERSLATQVVVVGWSIYHKKNFSTELVRSLSRLVVDQGLVERRERSAERGERDHGL